MNLFSRRGGQWGSPGRGADRRFLARLAVLILLVVVVLVPQVVVSAGAGETDAAPQGEAQDESPPPAGDPAPEEDAAAASDDGGVIAAGEPAPVEGNVPPPTSDDSGDTLGELAAEGENAPASTDVPDPAEDPAAAGAPQCEPAADEDPAGENSTGACTTFGEELPADQPTVGDDAAPTVSEASGGLIEEAEAEAEAEDQRAVADDIGASLKIPDPYFFVAGEKHSYLPLGGDCSGAANCSVSATPIQDALDAVTGGLSPDDGTIYTPHGDKSTL